MQHFSISNIKEWERYYRANFINSLSGFKPVSLIGTVDKEGRPNLAIFSNIVHLGADPALVGFINRPLEAAPHTMGNIRSMGSYTINHIHEAIAAQAHQTSAKYAAGESEFEATGLTALYKENCSAPFVAESNIQYALQLVDIVPIRYNNTYLVIGEITDVFVHPEWIASDGFISIDKAGSMVSLGIDGYFSTQPIARYAYAKPGQNPSKITF